MQLLLAIGICIYDSIYEPPVPLMERILALCFILSVIAAIVPQWLLIWKADAFFAITASTLESSRRLGKYILI